VLLFCRCCCFPVQNPTHAAVELGASASLALCGMTLVLPALGKWRRGKVWSASGVQAHKRACDAKPLRAQAVAAVFDKLSVAPLKAHDAHKPKLVVMIQRKLAHHLI